MKVLKYTFYIYVILLAGFATYKNVMQRNWGSQKVAFKEAKRTCYQGGEDWRFCIHSTERTNHQSYLYVFHSKGEDENMWSEKTGYAALLQKYWQVNESRIPKVITVSLGPVWLVTPKMSKEHTGLLERFQSEIFPVIEKHLGRPPKRRFLLGASMGGLNVLSIALHMPRSFSRVASLCPPLYTLSPYAKWSEIIKFAVKTGAQPASLLTSIGVGRYYFVNHEEWKLFSPLERIKTTRFKPHQKFYISAGLRDKFGLFVGAQKFVERLGRSGAITYWHPGSGDHCSIDVVSLGNFLSL